ncbi:cytochrome P450 81Q32-like [Oryza brachyantha]|uniref:cytochrome P450 81Q32-like n=1 Tax=Oryza brachyantha TaxID=4533 RepID=UPI001ADD21D8|nr:cytochrome P450 81Q32-like [Oryza brachyantha]
MAGTATCMALAVLLHVATVVFLVAVRLGRRTPRDGSLPLLGHFHLLRKPYHVTLAALGTAPLVTLRLGARRTLLVSTYAAAEECFTTHDVALAGRPQLLAGKHVGYGHTTLVWLHYGDRWRNLRRVLVVELFSAARLAALAADRRAEAVSLVRNILRDVSGAPPSPSSSSSCTVITFRPRFFEMVFNVLMRSLTAHRHGAGGDVARFEHLVEETFAVSGTLGLSDFFPGLWWVDRLRGVEAKTANLAAAHDAFITDIIDGHKRMRDAGVGDGGKRSTIDVLLRLQESDPKNYTDTVIKGLVLIILAAGTDTTTVTTEWLMAALLKHPEVFRRVRDEIDATVGTGRLVEEADITNLPYLQCVVKETLRLYPPAPIVPAHEAMEDCTVGGVHVRRGTMVVANLYAIHRDAEVWDAPEEFRPERFLDDVGGAAAATARAVPVLPTLPFGIGRRRCPGEAMATRIVFMAVAALVQCFDWDAAGAIDMAEGDGLTVPMATPLAAACRPREFVHGMLSAASLDEME